MGKRTKGDTRRGLLKEKEAAIQRSYYKYIAGEDSDSSLEDVSSICRSALTSKNIRARVSDDDVDGANDDVIPRNQKCKRKLICPPNLSRKINQQGANLTQIMILVTTIQMKL